MPQQKLRRQDRHNRSRPNRRGARLLATVPLFADAMWGPLKPLPDGFALWVAENEIVVAAFYLARQDRVDSLETRLHTLNLDFIALLEYHVITLHHLGGRDVHFVHFTF